MKKGLWMGILLTFFLAILANLIAQIPYVALVGPLVWAMLLGMLWRYQLTVRLEWEDGIAVSTKYLLRAGIILLGMRLDWGELLHAGWPAVLIATASVFVGISAVYAFARWLKVDRKLGFLIACGTGICGAAAIVALSAQLKAKSEETAMSVAVIAMIGTMFTIIYSLIYPLLPFTASEYGLFVGGTLHEIAHVAAAGAAGGDQALDAALIVKLSRVLLLIIVALFVGIWLKKHTYIQKQKQLPIPWFVFGFLVMSGLSSTGWIPEVILQVGVQVAYLLLSMAMVGLGLSIHFNAFRVTGIRPFLAGVAGSFILVSFVVLFIVFLPI